MSDAKQLEFGQRLDHIARKHRKLSHGFVTSMNQDGLVIARPRKQSSGVPLRGLFLCLLTLLAFKGFLFTHLGEADYSDRVSLLKNGTVVENIGAYAMEADPVTRWIAGHIAPIVR